MATTSAWLGRIDEIRELLGVELGGRAVAEPIPLDQATGLLSGQTQAAIVQALDDGAMLSLGAGESQMTWPHLRAALLRRGTIVDEPVLSPRVRWAIAVHESGHAIVGVELFGAASLLSIQIGGDHIGGNTSWSHEQLDHHVITAEHQVNRIVVTLAGISAEHRILGAAGMGIGVDVDSATDGVMTLIRYGLAHEWGLLGLDKLDRADRSDHLLDEYNAVTRQRLEEYARRADELVLANLDPIRALARHLAEVGHLAGHELQGALADARGTVPLAEEPTQ